MRMLKTALVIALMLLLQTFWPSKVSKAEDSSSVDFIGNKVVSTQLKIEKTGWKKKMNKKN